MTKKLLTEKLNKLFEVSMFLFNGIVEETTKKENCFDDNTIREIKVHYSEMYIRLIDPFNHAHDILTLSDSDRAKYKAIVIKYRENFVCDNARDFSEAFKFRTYDVRDMADKHMAYFKSHSMTKKQIECAVDNYRYAAHCITAMMYYTLDYEIAKTYELKLEDIYYWELKLKINPNQQPITFGRKIKIVIGYDTNSYMRAFTDFINDYCKEIEIIGIGEHDISLIDTLKAHTPDYLILLSYFDNYLFELDTLSQLLNNKPIIVVGSSKAGDYHTPEVQKHVDINRPFDEAIKAVFEK